MPTIKFEMAPGQRDALRRVFTETEAPCPYSKEEVDQMIDLAIHAVNEAAEAVARVTAVAPSPMVANALAWRMLGENADSYVEASQMMPTGQPGTRIVPSDEGDNCDCPGCQARRALMEQGATTIDLGNGITAIVVDPKTLN